MTSINRKRCVPNRLRFSTWTANNAKTADLFGF